jgi:ribose transport system permease protein
MGIRIVKTIMLGALIGGLFIGFAALLQESYVGKLVPTSGMASLSSIFRSLAIILLAGSFSSLFDQATAVLITGILVTGMFNFLTLIGVPSGTGQDIALGVLVIATGVISNIRNKGVVK